MGRSRGGMGGYRGRRTASDILKWVAIVLAIAVAIVLGGLFLGQDYIVYTDEGLRVELPFLPKEQEEETLDPDSLDVKEEPAGSVSEETEEPDVSVPAPGGEQAQVLSALELPLSAVLDGTAAQQLEEAGANALVLEMKDEEGRLAWGSAQPLSQYAGEGSGNAQVNEALKQWNEGDVYTVARVCCFRDNALPYHQNSLALKADYGNWRDEKKLRWLDPTLEQNQAYLAALCGELAQLGFDEIVLENAGCPVAGKRNIIIWNREDPESTILGPGGFVEQVRAAVEPYGTKVAVRTTAAALTGEEPGGGMNAEGIERLGLRLWLPAEEGLEQKLTAAGLTKTGERLVQIAAEALPESQISQAVFRNPAP